MSDDTTITTSSPASPADASPSADVQPGFTDALPATVAPPAEPEPASAKANEGEESKRWKEYSRRDKEIRAREKALKAKEERLALVDRAEQLAKEDPLQLLRLLIKEEDLKARGMSDVYEYVTDHVLNARRKDPGLSAVEREILELKQQLAAERQAAEQAQAERQIADFKRQLRDTVDDAGDRFELVRIHDAYEQVYDLIKGHHEATFDARTGKGEILSFERAASEVEEYLADEARKFAKAKKVRSLIDLDAQGDAGDQRGSDALYPTRSESFPQVGSGAIADRARNVSTVITNGHVSTANPTPQQVEDSIEASKRRAADLIRQQMRTKR